jgi:hypothetical protein
MMQVLVVIFCATMSPSGPHDDCHVKTLPPVTAEFCARAERFFNAIPRVVSARCRPALVGDPA